MTRQYQYRWQPACSLRPFDGSWRLGREAPEMPAQGLESGEEDQQLMQVLSRGGSILVVRRAEPHATTCPRRTAAKSR